MNTRKFANFICFIALGIIAMVLLVKFLGVRAFGLSSDFANICTTIAMYLGLFATLLSAYAFARSRRNPLYFWLFVLFVAVIVVFSFVL